MVLALSTNYIVNGIKSSGANGLALQVTKPARSAGLVEENSDREATSLADVRVYAFDHLLLVIDLGAVVTEDVAELVVTAARDTKSIHRAMDATVQIAGHGYQVHWCSVKTVSDEWPSFRR